jgi:hypothetical protein
MTIVLIEIREKDLGTLKQGCPIIFSGVIFVKELSLEPTLISTQP